MSDQLKVKICGREVAVPFSGRIEGVNVILRERMWQSGYSCELRLGDTYVFRSSRSAKGALKLAIRDFAVEATRDANRAASLPKRIEQQLRDLKREQPKAIADVPKVKARAEKIAEWCKR